MPRGFIGISGCSNELMREFHFLIRALVLATLLCQILPAHAQESPQEKTQAIQVSVERVNVGVIVTDASGQFVEGLRREDFHLFDNGVEQPLTDFAAIEEPGQVLLLIEAGPAVYLLEGGHLEAALALLEGLSPGDRVAVVKYAEGPQTLLDFTADKQAVMAAFGNLRFNLGFSSLNLSFSISKVLEWLRSAQGKKSLVLLSTGVDTSGSKETGLVLEKLRISDVRILAVSLTGGLQNPQPVNKKKSPRKTSAATLQQFEQADQLLKGMAESTGGRAYFPVNAKEFRAAYAEIAQIVRHEYSLAFAPPVRNGLVHVIKVRVDAPRGTAPNGPVPAYRIDHRQAYLAPLP
jgi:Ca-activated chloride channel family protein